MLPEHVAIGVVVAASLLAWTNSSYSQTKPQQDCLSYEPAVVTLSGSLARKTFPGPPNYENIRKGDRPEMSWFLELPTATCVNEDAAEPDLNPAQKAIKEIQLVLQPEQYTQHSALVGKKVVATGTLFGKRTAHHHTPVLLTVRTLAGALK